MNWGHPAQGKILLLAGDLTLAAVSITAGMLLRPGHPAGFVQRFGVTVVFALTFSTCFYIFDLYDVFPPNRVRTMVRLFAAAVVGTCMLSFLCYFAHWPDPSRGSMGMAVPLLFIASYGWRRFFRNHHRFLVRRRSLLLVGTREDAVALHCILKSRLAPYELVGFMWARAAAAGAAAGARSGGAGPVAVAPLTGGLYSGGGPATLTTVTGDTLIADTDFAEEGEVPDFGIVTQPRLEKLASHLRVETIVVRPDSTIAELAETLMHLRFHGVQIATTPDLCSQVLEELPLETLSDSWLSFATGFDLLHERLFRKIKRLTDILLAFAGLVAALPISLAVAFAIKAESPGPVLFTQWRVGWKERPFRLIKFRSMRLDAEKNGEAQWASESDPRVTHVGRVLRRLHIDEIPQMINVLMGEMSFVGPRPERPVFVEQLKKYIPFYHLRHHVPPGITGWAQVNYPYGASVEDAKRKLQYDLFYVRHASPTLDLRIILRTARTVLFQRGSR